MGINIYSMSSRFRVQKERQADALAAVKALKGKETQKIFTNTLGGHFSFVNMSEFIQADTLADAMCAWRWILEDDGYGDLCDPSFLGQYLGDEDILFSAIAPFVESGSYIQVFCHDDECIWRWVFENNGVRREYARIEFDYPGDSDRPSNS